MKRIFFRIVLVLFSYKSHCSAVEEKTNHDARLNASVTTLTSTRIAPRLEAEMRFIKLNNGTCSTSLLHHHPGFDNHDFFARFARSAHHAKCKKLDFDSSVDPRHRAAIQTAWKTLKSKAKAEKAKAVRDYAVADYRFSRQES